MGADFYAYAIIGARLCKQEFDKLMDIEHPQICCSHTMVKGHKYCPFCSKEIVQQTTPRFYLDDGDLNIPEHKTLKVVKECDSKEEFYYIGHCMCTFYQDNFDENKHFMLVLQATMLFPEVWNTLYAIGYDKPQNFGLYVVCNAYA